MADNASIQRSSLGGRRESFRRDSAMLGRGSIGSIEDEQKEVDFFEGVNFQEKRAMYIKTFAQLATFFVFLAVFTATVLSSQSSEQSRFGSHVRAHFTEGLYPLNNVRSIDDYWKYIDMTFLPRTFVSENSTDYIKAMEISPKLLSIDLNNRIVGAMRMWQVRVQRKQGCQVGALFSNYKTDCFQPLMEYTQDKEDYGPRLNYKYSEEVQGSAHGGLLGTYPSTGHVELLPPNETATRILMTGMKNDNWIGAPTRAVFIDFTIWNMNLNLHAVARITAEFSMSGVTETSTRVIVVQPRHLDPLSSSGFADLLAIVGEFVLVLFILFYIFEEITEFSITPRKYFLDPWNVLDWANLILLIFFVYYRSSIWLEAMGFEIGAQELMEAYHYTPMQSIAERLTLSRTINSFNSVLIWAKVVKYVGFMPYVKTLLVTLETCWKQYLSFLFMFLLVFIAFVIAYTIGFGETIRDLSGLGSTSVYLARSFLGDIDLTPVYLEAPIFGAALILMFMLGIYFLMINVFFAILLTALDEARGKNTQDFKQDMLVQSVHQIKEAVKGFFSIERRVRQYTPGLWAQLYKTSRIKRKQEEKKRLIAEKKKEEDKKRKIAHTSGFEALGMPGDGGDNQSSSSVSGADAMDKKDVLSAVENMAGKILSKIQGLSFELTTEMRDLQGALTKMESYTRRLSSKLEDLFRDQVQLIEDTAEG